MASCFILTYMLAMSRSSRANTLLAHAQHSVNLFDAEPVKDIGHQCLESHVFHARDILRSLEILRSAIQSTLPCIVHKILNHPIRQPGNWDGSCYATGCCCKVSCGVGKWLRQRDLHLGMAHSLDWEVARTLVTSPKARPSLRKYMTTPLPPF